MRTFVFRPRAADELLDVIQWYESQQAGLGIRFNAAVRSGLHTACEFPLRCPRFSGTQRRLLIRPFPFGLIYLVEPDRLVVTAVIDLRQDPKVVRLRIQREE